MGRNNDTFTLLIDKNREAWSKFRRALRKEDQLVFDEMWRAPKLHLAAGAFLANAMPLETIIMSMLLEQYKKIRQLEAAVQSRLVPASNQNNSVIAGEPDNVKGVKQFQHLRLLHPGAADAVPNNDKTME